MSERSNKEREIVDLTDAVEKIAGTNSKTDGKADKRPADGGIARFFIAKKQKSS